MNTAGLIGYWSAVLFVLSGFAFILVRRLQAGGFPPRMMLGLVVASLVQPGFVETGALRTALLSLASFAVAWTTAALVERQEPRRIVLLGSSLAGVQLLNPLCGAATTVVLPLALRRVFAKAGVRHGAGLYISLLFIPLLVVAYWSMTLPESPSLTDLSQKLSATFPRAAVIPIAASVPVALAIARFPNAVPLPVSAVIAVTTSLGAIGTAFAFQRPNVTTAVVSVLSVFVASCWSDNPNRGRNAALLIAVNLVLSWSLAIYFGGLDA